MQCLDNLDLAEGSGMVVHVHPVCVWHRRSIQKKGESSAMEAAVYHNRESMLASSILTYERFVFILLNSLETLTHHFKKSVTLTIVLFPFY